MKRTHTKYSIVPYYIAAAVGVVWAWTITYKNYLGSCLGIAACFLTFYMSKKFFPNKLVSYTLSWDELLQNLKLLKNSIQDTELRESVESIITDSEAIYKEISLYPEKESRVSRFKNSNLPDLIEILERYTSLPSSNTYNIASIKKQIIQYITTMQKIASQELDALYRNEDISLEVENKVLANMLEKTDMLLGG